MKEETLLKLILQLSKIEAQLEMALFETTNLLKSLRELWAKEYRGKK